MVRESVAGAAGLPTVLGARKNPDDRLLKDMVSPADYARWLVLKQRYIGHDSSVEKWRPVFAAAELYQEAIEDRGMSTRSVIDPVLDEAIKRRKLKVTEPRLAIKVPDPKRALKSFRDEQLGEDVRLRARRREVREEARALPVRGARHEDGVEIAEHARERLRLVRG